MGLSWGEQAAKGKNVEVRQVQRDERSGTAMLEAGGGARQSGSASPDEKERGRVLASDFQCAEARWKSSLDRRLQSLKCRGQKATFQDDGSTHIEGINQKGGLWNYTRFKTGILLDSPEREGSEILCDSLHGTGLSVYGGPLWLPSGSEDVHMDYEQGDQGHQGEIKTPDPGLPRRFDHIGPRRASLEVKGGDGLRLFGTSRLGLKPGEMSTESKQDIRIPGLAMEFRVDGDQNDRKESNRDAKDLFALGEASSPTGHSGDTEVSIPNREDQRTSPYVPRCVGVSGEFIQASAEGRTEAWMERQAQGAPRSPERAPGVASTCKPEQLDANCKEREDTGHIDDRRVKLGTWGNPCVARGSIPFCPKVTTSTAGTDFKLSGDEHSSDGLDGVRFPINSSEGSTLEAEIRQYGSGIRSCSKKSRIKPASASTTDSGKSSRDEPSTSPGTYCGKKKRDSGCPVKARIRGRLHDQARSPGGGLQTLWVPTDDRCIRNTMELQSSEVVRPKVPTNGGRVEPKLEGRTGARSPPRITDSSSIEKSGGGGSNGSFPASCLEGSGVVPASRDDGDKETYVAIVKRGIEGGADDGNSGLLPPPRTVYGGPSQTKERRGEEWFRSTMEEYGWGPGEIRNFIASVTETTWKGYCIMFAQFGELYRSTFPEGKCASFEQFGARSTVVVSRLMADKKITFATLTKLRSALSMVSESAFNKRMSSYAPLCRIITAARHTRRVRHINYNIWNPSVVFDYYIRQPDNAHLSFEDLTIKCILLLVITTSCRFAELQTILMKSSEWIPEGVNLSVKLKTSKERTFLLVTRINSNNGIFCPVR